MTTFKAFPEAARGQLNDLKASVESVRAKEGDLAAFFGEDAHSCPTDRVFGVLYSFSRDFDKALATLTKRRRAEERRKAGASGPGARGRGHSSERSSAASSSVASSVSPRAGEADTDSRRGIGLSHGHGHRRHGNGHDLTPLPHAQAPLPDVKLPPGTSASASAGAAGKLAVRPSPKKRTPSKQQQQHHHHHNNKRRSPGGVSALPSGRTASRPAGELEAIAEKMRVVLQAWGYNDSDSHRAVKALARPPLADLRVLMQSQGTLRAAVTAFFAHKGSR